MLDNYLFDTRHLLQSPSAPTSLYTTSDLTRWINIARGQVAGDGECIRYLASLSTIADQRSYNFSSISTGVAGTTGIAGIIHVRDILLVNGTSYTKLTPRPWEWFQQYSLNTPVPTSGIPLRWAQYGQGAAPGQTGTSGGGSFYLDPPPDQIYTLALDCVCYPIPLTSDDTVEALPYLWTDAVSFFAAYYAYLSAQSGSRQADAARMFSNYETFLKRARQAANPSVLRWQYPQASDPTLINKIGIPTPRAAQGGG